MPYEQRKGTYYIYKIVCHQEELCNNTYVGSTKNLATRKRRHNNDCNNPNSKYYHLKIYQIIRNNGGWDNWYMVPIKELKNTTKCEATIIEEEYRCQLKANMNTIRAYLSDNDRKLYSKEYRIQNKEHKCEYDKNYREKNKEERELKIDCKCGGKYLKRHKSTHFKTQLHLKYMNSKSDSKLNV